MGAHPYWYAVKYRPDIDAALDDLRDREFRAGRYNPVMPFIDFPITSTSPAPGPRHRSIQDAIAASDEVYRVASKLSELRESIPIPNDDVYCPVCHIANVDIGKLRTTCPTCGRELLKFGWD